MESSTKVLIIVPYFGDFPKWIDYFLLSCSKNKNIQWLLLSDSNNHPELLQNVKIVYFTLNDFNQLATHKLNLKIRVNHPYKICDFRPAFGKIFEEYINSYDFWGYSDIDLIYGNIRKFLPDEILNEFDLVSPRREYFTGHFALYRNTEKNNNLFKQIPIYQKIFTSSKHYAFDERTNYFGINMMYPLLIRKIQNFINKTRFKISPRNNHVRDMSGLVQKLHNENKIKVLFDDMVRSDNWYLKKNIKEWSCSWNDGELTDEITGEKLLHFHFLKSKKCKNFNIQPITKPIRTFELGPMGFSVKK